ncbi:MAG: hypothetical protein JST80_01355 [Bdellovibrionales bacterium]|nr:hypothetical protein [Bdellovibrionales bacterium]
MKQSLLSISIICLLLAPASVVHAQRPVNINASGNGGQDAHPGTTGSGGSDGWGGGWTGSGGKGNDGTGAGYSTPGTNAGHISIRLVSGKGKQVQMNGQIYGARTQNIGEVLITDQMSSINLTAQGGRGGNGGVGGDGGPGGDGGRGSDATQYSSGSNGGNGGNGGNAGNGTPGSNGGNGGNISVEVSEQDAQLLMLIGAVSNGAGQGGNPGQNGTGGRAGSGGPGGSSYSWTTSEYDGTDDKGNSKYRTEWHSNPGGSYGWSGSKGNDGTGNISGGQDGTNGQFQYIVGGKSYTTRYDFRVVGFDIDSENHDGIMEPGEIITVSNIRIQNIGGMPSPKYAPLKIFLRSHGWLISMNKSLQVESSIEPGQTADVVGTLQFRLDQEGTSTVGQPLGQPESVSPRVNQTKVDRDFVNSETQNNFLVRYPLQVDPIRVPKNMGPGQSAKISWTIKNISTREYGKLSDLKRVIESQLKINGDKTTTYAFTFLDAKGNPIDLTTGSLTGIDKLGPGEAITVTGTIQIPRSAEVYQKIGLNANLNLGSRTKGSDPKLIQTRQAQINISYVYHKSFDSKIVLVTNHDTTSAELKSWFALAKLFGIKMDVWDLSYEGNLDFDKTTESGESLADDLREKLLVVLNNTAEDTRAFQMVSRNQILNYALKNQIRVHFVGGDANELFQGLNDLLIPNMQDDKAISKDASDLMKTVKKYYSKGEGKTTPKAVRFLGQYDAKEDDWFKINAYDPKSIATQASDLMEQLSKALPSKRFIVMYHWEPKILDDGYVVNTIGLGRIKIYETLPDSESYVSAFQAEDSVIHGSDFILGLNNQISLISAMSIDEKLALLDRILTGQLPLDNKNAGYALNEVRRALIADIATEQKSIRKRPSEYSSADISELDQYPVLKKIADYVAKSKVKPDKKSTNGVQVSYANMLNTLVQDTYKIARSTYHDNYWFNNRVWDPSNTRRLASSVMKRWVEKVLKSVYAKKDVSTMMDAIDTEVEKTANDMKRADRKAYINQWTNPLSGLIRDALLLNLPEERIISDTQLNDFLNRSQTSENNRQALMSTFKDEKDARKKKKQ